MSIAIESIHDKSWRLIGVRPPWFKKELITKSKQACCTFIQHPVHILMRCKK
jgi:hypothetical protein